MLPRTSFDAYNEEEEEEGFDNDCRGVQGLLLLICIDLDLI